MLKSIEQMRHEIATAESQLESLKSRLDHEVQACRVLRHKWGKTVYEPIERKGYQTQGDPPGTMGVDWQGPMYIPASTTKQWSRTCASCGHKEMTQRTCKERMPGSVPGTSGEVEVPDFGDRQDMRGASFDTGPHWSDKTGW
jgi:hypothetical protein